MKSFTKAGWLLIVLYLFFFGVLWATLPQFPARLASHFDLSGTPNGWLSTSTYATLILILGLIFPLFIVVLMYFIRYLPDSGFNLPHREYWLAPEHREQTMTYLFQTSLWYACLTIGFVTGLHLLLLQANLQPDRHLSTPGIFGLGGIFILGTIVWVLNLTRHFKRKP